MSPMAEMVSCTHCGEAIPPDARYCNRCGTETPTGLGRGETEIVAIPIRAGEVIEGTWEVESRLGRGGMGSVFLAHDLRLERKVAIKVLAGELCGNAEFVTRFEREARLTARLEHPNVVPIYAVGRHGVRPYIVMKHLEGTSLAAHLRARGGPVPLDETMSLMRQICGGLGFIHEQGFIHRDVKAANIVVGPGGRATILDFGILREQDGGDGLTRTGLALGTPSYMSPEQALGKRDIDHRSDLYALGIILFELLTGTRPFTGENELSVIQKQAHEIPPRADAVNPEVPAAVASVVARALAKAPEDRYQTAGELLAALERAVAGNEPSIAVEIDVARPRRRGWLPAVLVVGVLSLSGAGAAWVLLPRDGAPVPPTAVAASVVPEPAAEPEPVAAAKPEAAPEPAIVAEPEPQPEPVVAAPPPERQKPARVKKPRRPKRAPKPAPLALEPGRIRVVTTWNGKPYWAQVTIDGVPRGETPLATSLPAGTHEVQLVRTGFKSETRKVEIRAGEVSVLRVDLQP